MNRGFSAARYCAVAVLLYIFSAAFLIAQEPPPIYYDIERAIQGRDQELFLSLSSSDSGVQKNLNEFFSNFSSFPSNRIVMKLAELKQNRLLVHILLQTDDEAIFESWAIQLAEEQSKTVIKSASVVSSVDGLYHLRLGGLAVPVRNLSMDHHDSTIHMDDGHLFILSAGGKPAGVIFIGKGSFQFSPSDPKEQQQLMLFGKKPKIDTKIDQFYLRASTNTLKNYFGNLVFTKGIVKEGLSAKAQNILKESDQNAFGVRLPFSDELWFPRLLGADLYAELKTGSGNLIYQFAPKETEDVLLLDKGRDRIISLYSSDGEYSAVPQFEDFKIVSYKMNVTYNPTSNHLSAVSDVRLQTQEINSSIIFKMNPELRVSKIESARGALIYFQERTTNNLHVVMNEVLEEGSEIDLRFYYQGRIEPDRGRAEVQISSSKPEGDFYLPPSFLYSNASQWYPQLASRPYSPIDISINVPVEYAAISNGVLKNIEQREGRLIYSYECNEPVKYFSLLIGRISSSLTQQSIVPMQIFFYSIDRSNAQQQGLILDKLVRFYEDYFGKYPYGALNMALRPWGEPGGHAPATFVIANRVFTFNQSRFQRDPLYIPEFPDFILAHEVAHQWWGQAVGWRNYRDQWLSEGFAHFAASEYIRSQYGDAAWLKLSKVFYNWIEQKTRAGPLSLGSRLGHLTNDSHAFSALLYNKGAYVLIMLKNWMGAEKFSECMSDFFNTFLHQKASVEDFQLVAQRYSTDDLSTFFNQWLNRWDIPDIRARWEFNESGNQNLLKLKFEQANEIPYLLKIPVIARSSDGKVHQTDVLVDREVTETEIKIPFRPASIEIDPLRQNLMRLRVKEK